MFIIMSVIFNTVSVLKHNLKLHTPCSLELSMWAGCLWAEEMESPSPTVRRRAWINSSRQWGNLEGLDSDEVPGSFPSASIADDDVFSDGMPQTLMVGEVSGHTHKQKNKKEIRKRQVYGG